MKIHYDPEVDALNITFKEAKVHKTKEIAPEVLLDVASNGDPLYLEILGARTRYRTLDIHDILFRLPRATQPKRSREKVIA